MKGKRRKEEEGKEGRCRKTEERKTTTERRENVRKRKRRGGEGRKKMKIYTLNLLSRTSSPHLPLPSPPGHITTCAHFSPTITTSSLTESPAAASPPSHALQHDITAYSQLNARVIMEGLISLTSTEDYDLP